MTSADVFSIKTVAVVGVGLIGGSFALALKKAGFGGRILGVSSPSSIQAALDGHAIDEGVSLSIAAAQADLVYLSQPIDRILELLPELSGMVRRDSLVTDAGSTKAEIVRVASEAGLGAQFVGGHPMAGKETRGMAAAHPDLFAGRPYVLTRANGMEPPYEPDFRRWLQRIGARVIDMEPEQHDQIVAGSSHLPQLLATTLALTLSQTGEPLYTEIFGPGLLDMTRLALSAPDVWLSVLRTNRERVGSLVDEFKSRLSEVQDALRDEKRFERLFDESAHFARQLRQRS